ncbi:hypothetical protein BO443_30089 [Burkholderia orbicola]
MSRYFLLTVGRAMHKMWWWGGGEPLLAFLSAPCIWENAAAAVPIHSPRVPALAGHGVGPDRWEID